MSEPNPTLHISEQRQVAQRHLVEVVISGVTPRSQQVLEHVDTGVAWEVQADDGGEATLRLALLPRRGVPYMILNLMGTDTAVGVGDTKLSAVAVPDTGVVWVGRDTDVRGDVRLSNQHLVVRGGTTLTMSPGVEFRLEGGSLNVLGTVDEKVVMKAADEPWGGIRARTAVVRMWHTALADVRASSGGGAIDARSVSSVSLCDVTVDRCRGACGGAMRIEHSELSARRVRCDRNRSTTDGGAIALIDSQAQLVACKLGLKHPNEATNRGGALFLQHGVVLLEGVQARGNVAGDRGDDLYGWVPHLIRDASCDIESEEIIPVPGTDPGVLDHVDVLSPTRHLRYRTPEVQYSPIGGGIALMVGSDASEGPYMLVYADHMRRVRPAQHSEVSAHLPAGYEEVILIDEGLSTYAITKVQHDPRPHRSG